MSTTIPPATRREIYAWAMYDFANSGYTTVVLTAVFNTYFVSVVARDFGTGTATLLWTIAMAIANGLVLLTAPLFGAIADCGANKKRFLAVATLGCVTFTATLSLAHPGSVVSSMVFVILASLFFYMGENFIAAFLPEISTPERMGRVSSTGWTIGYIGGLIVLGLCLMYVRWGQERGLSVEQYVPNTMWIVAICFAVASTPTFLWLKERAKKSPKRSTSYFRIGFFRLRDTWQHARRYQDLFRFLVALTVYYCGINTVIVLAAVYAQEVMGFNTQDTLVLILVVNVTAALGAFIFGRVQDLIGSRKTLMLTLCLWITATVLAYFSNDRSSFWLVANIVGIALGSSQSAGRALVGMFSPPARSGEFFGLWGLATKLAAVIGPLVYGFITYATHGNHRVALLSTGVFFIIGIILLMSVDEQRGIAAARESNE